MFRNLSAKRYVAAGARCLNASAPKPIITTIPVKKPSFARKFFRYTAGFSALAIVSFTGVVAYKIHQESNPADQQPQVPFFPNGQKKKTLVILGSGWGSIPLLKQLDTTLYNVVVISPRNYFLFTPLLPSAPTGTIDMRSIVEPVRSVTRSRPGEVIYLEAEATDIDPVNNRLTIKQSTTVHSGHSGKDSSSLKLTVTDSGLEEITTSLNYDYLVVGVGAQPSTFGIPGVAEHSTFLKEVSDANAIRSRLMDAIEAANILPKGDPERKRLLSIVVCGGGPTGVEVAGELQDYIDQDLVKWMPEVASELKVTLIEAMPHVLLSFNTKLVDYAQQVFHETNIDLKTNTRVMRVNNTCVEASSKNADGLEVQLAIPYGLLIWATGNAPRPIVRNLMSKVEEQKNARRGLLINENLLVDGTDNIFALGDCTFTKNPPTAQVAFQEGNWLAKHFKALHKIDRAQYLLAHPDSEPDIDVARVNKQLKRLQEHSPPFQYQHQGALAYIGSERAVADLAWNGWSNVTSGGTLTFLLWRSAYVYMSLSIRNQILVILDWTKVSLFGRDCSKE